MKTIELPADYATWEAYTKALLAAEHPMAQDHYVEMFAKFIAWHQARGYEIFDAAEPKLETAKKVASWRRMAKVVLNGDIHGKALSFGPTKRSLAVEKAIQGCEAALAI